MTVSRPSATPGLLAILLSFATLVAACSSPDTLGSADQNPSRFLIDGTEPCAINFGRQAIPPVLNAASIPTAEGTVWVQTRALGLGDWEETIDGVGVVRGRFDGRFTLAWEAPSLATAPLSATNEINAPESLADEIDGIAAEAVRSASFANDVEVVKAAVGAGATYSGVASSYDVMVVFEDSDDRNQLLIAGEPLPEERNAATWGPFDDPDTPGLSSTDIFSTATPAVIDGQVVYWPPQADLRGDARGEFRGLVESLAAGEPTVAVTASGAWANACPDDRQFDDGAVELAAADVVTAHQVTKTDSGWQLCVELDAPEGFFPRDGLVFNLLFGAAVRLQAKLQWDEATQAIVVPDKITFEALLTRQEAELFDGLLRRPAR